MQVVNTNTFKDNQTKIVFNIYHIIACKNQCTIYVLECSQYNIQYVGKSETNFNIRLNNHQKDVSNPNAIAAFILKKHITFSNIQNLL